MITKKMGLINKVYGLVLLFLAVDAFLLGIVPEQFLPVAVIMMGVIVFLTPLRDLSGQSRWTHSVRQYGFGLALVALGVSSLVPSLLIIGYEVTPFFTTYSLSGQLIIAAIGFLYLFALSPQASTPIMGR